MRRRKRPGLCIFPGYRYCGPGCSGPGEPINDVDDCCFKHDECLRRGISLCKCDELFMDCLCSKINLHTEKGRHANLMYQYMKLQTAFTCKNRRKW